MEGGGDGKADYYGQQTGQRGWRIDGGGLKDLVLTPALTFYPLPQERE
jgi:hypothetical protein